MSTPMYDALDRIDKLHDRLDVLNAIVSMRWLKLQQKIDREEALEMAHELQEQ